MWFLDWRVDAAKRETLAKAAKSMWKTFTGCHALWNKIKVYYKRREVQKDFQKKKKKTIGDNEFSGVFCFAKMLLSWFFKFCQWSSWMNNMFEGPFFVLFLQYKLLFHT